MLGADAGEALRERNQRQATRREQLGVQPERDRGDSAARTADADVEVQCSTPGGIETAIRRLLYFLAITGTSSTFVQGRITGGIPP